MTWSALLAAGFLLGLFFNVTTLAAVCALAMAATLALTPDQGVGGALAASATALASLQLGYVIGCGLIYAHIRYAQHPPAPQTSAKSGFEPETEAFSAAGLSQDARHDISRASEFGK